MNGWIPPLGVTCCSASLCSRANAGANSRPSVSGSYLAVGSPEQRVGLPTAKVPMIRAAPTGTAGEAVSRYRAWSPGSTRKWKTARSCQTSLTAGRLPAQHVGQRPASAHRRAPRAASVAQPTPRRTRPERSRPTSRRPAASRPVRTDRRRRRAPRSWAGQRRPAAAATSRAAAGTSSGQRARCSRTRCPSAAPRSRPYRHWVPHRCGCRARRPAPAPLSPRSRSTPPQAWFPAAGGARHPTGAPPAGAAARPGRIPAVPGPAGWPTCCSARAPARPPGLPGGGPARLRAARGRGPPGRPSAARPDILPWAATPAVNTGGLGALTWVALKVGLLSYGGGFVIVPLMQADAVDRIHWMRGPY